MPTRGPGAAINLLETSHSLTTLSTIVGSRGVGLGIETQEQESLELLLPPAGSQVRPHDNLTLGQVIGRNNKLLTIVTHPAVSPTPIRSGLWRNSRLPSFPSKGDLFDSHSPRNITIRTNRCSAYQQSCDLPALIRLLTEGLHMPSST